MSYSERDPERKVLGQYTFTSDFDAHGELVDLIELGGENSDLALVRSKGGDENWIPFIFLEKFVNKYFRMLETKKELMYVKL